MKKLTILTLILSALIFSCGDIDVDQDLTTGGALDVLDAIDAVEVLEEADSTEVIKEEPEEVEE